MKINELLGEFRIALSNEEAAVLEKMAPFANLGSYLERDQTVIEGLIRKSLVNKVMRKGEVFVIRNDT
jgi:hypothetical protein